MKEITVNEHLQEKLKNPYFKELHELEEQKYTIVRKIIDHRIREKLTQGELAKRIGVSQQHISKIESGEFSSVTTLEKVLLGIGMTVRIQAIELNTQTKKKIARVIARHKHLQIA
jgi:transcriptional regulator with XRE-family HTH domain